MAGPVAAVRRGMLAAVVVCVVSTASAAAAPRGFLTTPRDEILPVSYGSFMWSQNSAAHPHRYTEYVERNPISSSGTGPRIRVNAAGTQGFSGGVTPTPFGGIIYQQVKGHQSDLKIFNGQVRRNPPVGVNTPAWEYRPSAARGAWILFGRFTASTHRRKIILFDLFNHKLIVLADRPAGPPGNPSATPGQVNGNFAVWSQCTATACNVWEYDIATATKTRLPNTTPGHYNYAPSVDTAGTVYFAHGGRTCGGAEIEKQPLGGAASIIWSLNARGDVTSSNFTPQFSSISPSLLYARYSCANGSNDVFEIPNP